MGAVKKMFCVDTVLLIYYRENEKCTDCFKQDEITSDLFQGIKNYISDNTIQRIELKKDDVSMTIFYENGLAHIGIVDMYNDIIYYYKNGEDQTLVPIAGQVFGNRIICKDNHMLWVILEYFAKHGEKYPQIDWCCASLSLT